MADTTDPQELQDRIEVATARIAALQGGTAKLRALNEALGLSTEDWQDFTCPLCGATTREPPSVVRRDRCSRCRLKELGGADVERHLDAALTDLATGNGEHAAAHLETVLKKMLETKR